MDYYVFLKEGRKAWDKLRLALKRRNLSRRDLSRRNLSEHDFSLADLTEANLTMVNLTGANLTMANLTRANLSGSILSGANLIKANLTEASLSEAKLTGAIFTGANLTRTIFTGANLTVANLTQTDLIETNLREATLSLADLTGAILSLADLTGAILSLADLTGAILSGVDLSGAILSGANLSEATLSGANLSGANLSEATLSGANLSGANLSGANFSGANLSEANLSEANFSGANLSEAILSSTQALATDFTSAKFTGACLQDWNINSATKLNDINCQYVYLKIDKQERRPSNAEFAPGEFTKLFQKALETVDLIFADGIDWKAFFLSLQELRAKYGKENLSVQAIEKKNGGAFVIRLEVPPEANKSDVESQAKESYKIQLKEMEEKYHKELHAKDEQIAIYRQYNASLENVINILGNRPIQNIITVTAQSQSESMSESYQSKYDQRNSNNQFIDTAQPGSQPTFNQYNYTPEQKKNLAEAAAEIQQLLNQLEQSYPTKTTVEKMAVVSKAVDEIEKNPTLKARVIGALKTGGTEAFKELVDNPLINILLASIEGWQEAE